MNCSITIHPVAGKAFAPWLGRWAIRATPLAAPQLRELSIVLVGDAGISRLHRQFFGDSSTTDVITFPLEQNSRGLATAGEIYLCVPMAVRQARHRKIDAKNELLLYVIHGMLHLSGYDDMNAKAYDKMHEKEDNILKRLGIGRVFHTQAEK